MRSRVPFVSAVLVGAVLAAGPVRAQTTDQRGDVSVQLSVRSLHEFDETEAGFGARLSYRLSRWFAADGEVNLFPGDAGSPAFSGSRLEGLAGVRVGPHFGRTGVFLALRGGAVRFWRPRSPSPALRSSRRPSCARSVARLSPRCR